MNVRIDKAEAGFPSSTDSWPFGRTFEAVERDDGEVIPKWTVEREKKVMIEQAARRYIKGEKISQIASSISMHPKTLYRNLVKASGPIWIQKFNSKLLNIHAEVPTDVGALLDAETRRKVLRQKELNKTFHGKQKNFYVLSHFIWCGHCGSRLNGKPSGDYSYYSHKTEDKPKCSNTKGTPVADLETAVMVHLIHTFGDVERIEQAVKRAHNGDIDQERFQLEDEQTQVGKTERDYINRRKEIIRLLGKKLFDEKEAKEELNDIRKGIQACNDRLEAIETELDSLPKPKQVKEISKRARKVMLNVFSGAMRDPQNINKDTKRRKKMTDKQKRKIIEYAFDGVDSKGKPLGVYLHRDDEGKYSVRITCQLGENLLNWAEIIMLNKEVEPGEYVPIREDLGTKDFGKYQRDPQSLQSRKCIRPHPGKCNGI